MTGIVVVVDEDGMLRMGLNSMRLGYVKLAQHGRRCWCRWRPAGLREGGGCSGVVECQGRLFMLREPKRAWRELPGRQAVDKKTGTHYLDSTSAPVQFLSKTK